jgi:hypothetical protein
LCFLNTPCINLEEEEISDLCKQGVLINEVGKHILLDARNVGKRVTARNELIL